MKQPANNVALEELITAYCAAWSEPDPGRREQMLKDVWVEEGTYTDPTAHATGRRELVEHIGKVLARYPGARMSEPALWTRITVWCGSPGR